MYSLAKHIRAGGEDVVVFADHHGTQEQNTFDRNQDFRISRYRGFKPYRRRRKAWDMVAFARANGAGARLIADTWKSLEHVDGLPFSAVLCLAHGTELPPRPSLIKLRRIRKSFGKAACVVANSEYTAGLAKLYINDTDKIRVVYPGVETPVSDGSLQQAVAQRLAPHVAVLITVARLEQRKGQHQVIRALPGLVREFPSLLYVIIGEGSERDGLEKLASDLGVSRNLLFAGQLQGAMKNAYLANSDVFVMPGSKIGRDIEGFGMAYIEAACFGVPAVACRAGGAAEAVIHEHTGLVCDPDRPEQLQEAIRRLLSDRTLRERLGQNAQARSAGFHWPGKIREYISLLDSGSRV
jgi:phosphatidylinositol alpha-1,6-mannosyltransferase